MYRLIITLMLLAPAAQAADCLDMRAYAERLTRRANEVCTRDGSRWQGCDARRLAGETVLAQIWKATWNSWISVGPRYLESNAPQHGTLHHLGHRTFGSLGPMAGDARLTIAHRGGQADLTVSYCVLRADGGLSVVATDEVKNGGEVPPRQFSADQVRGRFVIARLEAREAGRRYEYTITLAGAVTQ